MQSRYKIARQERAVAGHAYHPGDVWRAPSRPIEAGENAGERARITWHAVGDDREPSVGEARKIELWTARHGVALADWPAAPVDPFFNVNTPEDAVAAERLAAQHPGA